jgi:hypothetical protein
LIFDLKGLASFALPPNIYLFLITLYKIYLFLFIPFADVTDKKNRITDLKSTLFKSVEQNKLI